MSEKITIEPVTRIAGHGKISIYLDDRQQVEDAKFHVTEYRGFEKFCEGRPLAKMAGVIGHVCGICPVSHIISTAKAIEKIQGITIPDPAKKLRRLLNLAQIIQSHSLSFFYLCSPDLLLGWDTPPENRNLFNVIKSDHRDLAVGGIKLRQLGQEITELVAGRKVNPPGIIPGGIKSPLSRENRDKIGDRIPESLNYAQKTLDTFKSLLDSHSKEVNIFGNFPSLFMGLLGEDDTWEHYEGKIRVIDTQGNIIVDSFSEDNYQDFIGETVEPGTYLKFPYYKPQGYPEGNYRVGPLARLNLCEKIGTPRADRELLEYRDRAGTRYVTSSFYFHYARLIEIIACLEKIQKLLEDPEIISENTRIKVAKGKIDRLNAVGVSEAPRGILFHDYQTDAESKVKKLNLLIATGQNVLSMNKTIAQIAREYIDGPDIPETILNRIEAGIRIFDPCLGCSTHAMGQMPLHVRLCDRNGKIVKEIWRD